jgi:WD40 repeat protein
MKTDSLIKRLIIISALLFAVGVRTSRAGDDPVRQRGSGAAITAAWSPDGERIAVGSDTHLAIYTPVFEHVAAFAADDVISSLVWNPNNRQIATASRARLVQLWDLPSGTPRTLHTESIVDNRYSGSVSYSPDGSLLASAHLDNAVRIWDTVTGTLVKTLDLEAPAYAVAWHPNGEWIAVGSSLMIESRAGDEVVVASFQIWDVETAAIIARLDTGPSEIFDDYPQAMVAADFVPVRYLQWYAGGQRLLMETSESIYDDSGWDIESGSGAFERMNILAECGTSNKTARFAPDGYTLAMGEFHSGCDGSGNEDAWGVEIASQNRSFVWRSLYLGTGEIQDITWHPDNLTFAVVAGDGSVVISSFDPSDSFQNSLEPELILEP